MPILSDIQTLEELVAELMSSVGRRTPSDARVQRAAARAIIELLDEAEFTAEQLLEPEAIEQIQQAVDEVFADWEDELRRQVVEAVKRTAELTEKFFSERGLEFPGLRLAAERSELAQAVTEAFNEGFRNLRRTLGGATRDAMIDQILAGDIDATALANTIVDEAETITDYARIQAKAAINGYNQVHRNLIAERGGLDHFHYYGSLQVNSRPFCRIHIGYVFPQHRIEQMRNGMLEPVLVFKGGFNCRHSWLPVDPAWSQDIRDRIVDVEPTEVAVDAAGNRKITVCAPEDRIARLEAQIPLQRRGFIQFIDAESNTDGFVAIHEDWHLARFDARTGSTLRQSFENALADAIARAENGESVILTIDVPEPVAP